MVAHGTRNALGVTTVCQIVDAVCTRRPELSVRLCWIELVEPDLRTALAAVPAGRPMVLVPLLLSSGYHDRVDIPAAVAEVRPGTVRTPVLGPDPALAVALADRLAAAGLAGADAVVLAAAGSSDPGAVAAVQVQAAALEARTGRPVTVGFGSAAAPTVPDAVAAARAAGAGRVAVAPYLLAPGHFIDRLLTAGANGVAAPLGAHPEVVGLVLRRYEDAARSTGD